MPARALWAIGSATRGAAAALLRRDRPNEAKEAQVKIGESQDREVPDRALDAGQS
jgi:hypothetical protein